MPRVIQMPLSGGDRKAQAKELRRARGLYDEHMRQAAVVRAEAREQAHRLDEFHQHLTKAEASKMIDEMRQKPVWRQVKSPDNTERDRQRRHHRGAPLFPV
ncbi:hypothetical protein ACVWXL_009001 [Bradyrhizobium sp. GM22.5]